MASSQDAVVRRHLADAARAGPYLWSEEDVSNALLWFRHSSPSSVAGGDDANRAAEGGDNEEGCEFLRRLLHARGTTMPRPSKQKRRKKESTTEKGAAAGGETTRRKRSKKGEQKVVAAQESSPLQAVMMGYYQLMLPPEPSNTSDGDGDNHEGVQFTTADIQKAEMASSQLLDDLSSIVSARRHTNDVYQAYTNVSNREGGDEGFGSIDEYMTRPSTCTLRVYASNIFDRLLDLCPGASENTATDATMDGTHDNGSNPALERYLQKLFGMAPTNVKIREVILLLLLEPVRRLQLQRQQSKQPQPLSEQLIPEPRERRQQSPSTHLSPMLLSSCWVDIPPETVERECSRPPLPALIASVLNTSRRSDKPSVVGNGSTPTIDWWTLPSPLLCAASQLHLGLALEYIRYWIDKALAGHGKLYDVAPCLVAASGTEEEDSFQHAMQRIQQFLLTSERLNLLGYHVLRSMEKESQESFDVCSLDDDEEDAAFRRSLAWKAIYRAVAVSKAPGID
ncbi:hypothetical protein ACHAXT_012790 [Thalassiosira profunda]